jgi:hypothetical protein
VTSHRLHKLRPAYTRSLWNAFYNVIRPVWTCNTIAAGRYRNQSMDPSGRIFGQNLHQQYPKVLQYTYPTCVVFCILSSSVSAALITNTTFEFKKIFRVYCEAYKRNEMIQFLIERWHCSTTLVSSSYYRSRFILFRRGGRVIWNCFRRFSWNSSHLRNDS